MIRTALSAKFYEVPGFEAARAAVTASRRVGEPKDIAEPVLFLLSASDRRMSTAPSCSSTAAWTACSWTWCRAPASTRPPPRTTAAKGAQA
jgi:NAD(P)-dependent dehydrogenase (short-subunit alcohol dehydrogenase family)